MDIRKLLENFPGAKVAYEQGQDWEWQPAYEDGYPHPIFNDAKKQWELKSIYPGFVMRSRDVEVHVHEMTEEGGRVDAFRVPLHAGEQVLQGLFVEISHRCWQATRGYLEFARLTGRDPLKLCGSPTTQRGDVEEAALYALAEHLATPHGQFAAMQEGGDEYTH